MLEKSINLIDARKLMLLKFDECVLTDLKRNIFHDHQLTILSIWEYFSLKTVTRISSVFFRYYSKPKVSKERGEKEKLTTALELL